MGRENQTEAVRTLKLHRSATLYLGPAAHSTFYLCSSVTVAPRETTEQLVLSAGCWAFWRELSSSYFWGICHSLASSKGTNAAQGAQTYQHAAPEEVHKQLLMLSSSLVLGLLHFISLLIVITWRITEFAQFSHEFPETTLKRHQRP